MPGLFTLIYVLLTASNAVLEAFGRIAANRFSVLIYSIKTAMHTKWDVHLSDVSLHM